MALPDYIQLTQGTAIVWGESGASGVAAVCSLNNLAGGSAQQGASVDLGANWEDEYTAILAIETGTAPTAGNTYELYFGFSHDNTNWPAKMTGSNGAYTLGTSDANLRQIGTPAVVLVVTNDGNTLLIQAGGIIRPRARYVAPLVDNNSGQATRNQATASNNLSRVYLVPRRLIIND
jgi:hypothetical protein